MTHDIKGIFEIHITVKCESDEQINLFTEICKMNNVKPIIIMLTNGENIRQVMTSKFFTGKFTRDLTNTDHSNIFLKATDLMHTMFDNTILKNKIERLKIEALSCSDGVPSETHTNDDQYFEFHHKIQIKNNDEYLFVKKLVKNHDSRLSSNAFKYDVNGNISHYFVTRRVHKYGRNRALELNDELKNELTIAGYIPLKSESEYVVYDSNFSLDNGWTI